MTAKHPVRELDTDGSDISVNETTALLSSPSERFSETSIPTTDSPPQPKVSPTSHEQTDENNEEDEDRPLPLRQIILLCAAKMCEPICFFSIFPFINQMVYDTGQIQEEDVGFYSGLIESLFSITQMISMIPWGRAADRYGRKPILIISLVAISIAAGLFGYSRSVWEMILWRCLGGCFSGTVVTLRAMVTENSTKKTQARAFSIFGFFNNLGIVFFKDYPYALPTTVTGGSMLVFAMFASFFVKETLTPTRRKKATQEQRSVWELIKTPGVAKVLFIYSQTMLQAFGYTAISTVFWFTRPALGGFGFSPIWISASIAAVGVSQSTWLLLAFPYLQRRFSTGAVLRGCTYGWLGFLVMYPLSNELLRHDQRTVFWIVFPLGLVLGSGIAMSFTAIQLALNDIAPSSATLGTLNGVALSLTSGTRAFAPALFTSIYAVGVKGQILRGHLIWAVLFGTATILFIGVRYLPAKAEGRLKKEDDPE